MCYSYFNCLFNLPYQVVDNMKKTLIVIIGVLSGLYLVNPGFGVFEFIPDNVPLVGNLDEGMASFLLLSSLAYFDIDIRDVFGNWWKRKQAKD